MCNLSRVNSYGFGSLYYKIQEGFEEYFYQEDLKENVSLNPFEYNIAYLETKNSTNKMARYKRKSGNKKRKMSHMSMRTPMQIVNTMKPFSAPKRAKGGANVQSLQSTSAGVYNNPYFVRSSSTYATVSTPQAQEPEPYIPSMPEPYVPPLAPPYFASLIAEAPSNLLVPNPYERSTDSHTPGYIGYRSVLTPSRTSDELVDRVSRTFINDCLSSHSQILINVEPEVEYKPPALYTYSSYRDSISSESTTFKIEELTALASNNLVAAGTKQSVTREAAHCFKTVASASVSLKPKQTLPPIKLDVSLEEGQIGEDDDVIVLEEGEVVSDTDICDKKKPSPKKTRRHSSKAKRSKKSRSRSRTTKKLPEHEISLDEITIDGSDDDEIQLVAIVAAGKPKGSAINLPNSKTDGASVNSGKLGAVTRLEQIRRRSLLRQSSSRLLSRRLSFTKGKGDPKALGNANTKPLKRLRRTRWGTPIASIQHQKNFIQNSGNRHHLNRYFSMNNNTENEERTGKNRKRRLIEPNHMYQGVPLFSNFPTVVTGCRNEPFDRSNCVSRTPLGKARPVIIDGSNVAIAHGNNKIFSSRGLELCVIKIKEKLRHSDIVCFVPRFRAKQSASTETHILTKLEEDGILKYTPSREVGGKNITSYDDKFILEYASDVGGIIITNDNYKDLYQEKPEWKETIERRLLQYTWVNDRLMFPEDPLGKNGPSLEQFCSFGV